MKQLLYCLAICVALVPAVVNAQTPRIAFTAPALYPEGTVYDAAGDRFFVSSERTGTIGTVTPQGDYKVFYADSSLKSSFGMKIDANRKWLWVCTGDPNYSKYSSPETYRKRAHVIILELGSAKKIKDIDLGDVFAGEHFLNDITLDAGGNAYVTDSYSPVIYRITPGGAASVFATDPMFSGKGIGLNGIVWQKGGILLTINDATGALLKIPVATPTKISVVSAPQSFPGGDGLLLDGDQLLLVQNKGVNIISRLQTTDQWKTATISGRTSGNDRFQNPSTLTADKEKIYAMNAKLNELTDSTLNPSKEFSLQLVQLKP